MNCQKLSKALRLLRTTVRIGVVFTLPAVSAHGFDKDAARKLLNPNATPEKPTLAPEQQAALNELNQKEGRSRNTEEPVLPKECNLISYTSDGANAIYRCGEEQIITGIKLFSPEETDEILATRIAQNPECQLRDVTSIGYPVSCNTSEGVFITYTGTLPSGLTENIIATEQFAEKHYKELAAIQNLSHSIYFYKRHVARDNEQVKYLTDMLNQAFMINVDALNKKADENGKTSADSEKNSENKDAADTGR